MITRLVFATFVVAAGAAAGTPAAAMPAGVGDADVFEGVTVQIDGTPHVGAERIATFVLARASIGTRLISLSYKDGGWTARVQNIYACVRSVPIDCRTFPSAYFLINDRLPLRVSGWGIP